MLGEKRVQGLKAWKMFVLPEAGELWGTVMSVLIKASWDCLTHPQRLMIGGRGHI